MSLSSEKKDLNSRSNNNNNNKMGRLNIYLDDEEDSKLHRLQKKFNIKSKEDVIKRLIKKFDEGEDDVLAEIENLI